MQVIIISQSWDIKYCSVYFCILVVFQEVQLSSLIIKCLLEHWWCGTSFVLVALFSQDCIILLSLAPWHMHVTQHRKSGNRQDPGAQLSQIQEESLSQKWRWTARTSLTLLWIHVPTVTYTHTHTYVQHTNRMMSKWLELLLSWRTSIQSPKPMYKREYAEQADPWASPPSLPSLLGELLASQRTALLCTGRELPEKQHSKLTSGLHIHTLTHTYMHMCTHTHSGGFYSSEYRMDSGFLLCLFLAHTVF